MRIKYWIVIVIVLLCFGCAKKEEPSVNIGKVISVKILPSFFPMSQVETDKGIYIIRAHISVEKGKEIRVYKSYLGN